MIFARLAGWAIRDLRGGVYLSSELGVVLCRGMMGIRRGNVFGRSVVAVIFWRRLALAVVRFLLTKPVLYMSDAAYQVHDLLHVIDNIGKPGDFLEPRAADSKPFRTMAVNRSSFSAPVGVDTPSQGYDDLDAACEVRCCARPLMRVYLMRTGGDRLRPDVCGLLRAEC